MVNTNLRVVKLTVYCLSIYLIISIADLLFTFPGKVFAKVNLISNLVKEPANQLVIAKTEVVVPIEIVPIQKKKFNLYLQKGKITSFNSDTNITSIKSFIEKIAALKSGKKKRKYQETEISSERMLKRIIQKHLHHVLVAMQNDLEEGIWIWRRKSCMFRRLTGVLKNLLLLLSLSSAHLV